MLFSTNNACYFYFTLYIFQCALLFWMCSHFALMVGMTRIELVTSRLSGVHSNHLSYRPDKVQCLTHSKINNTSRIFLLRKEVIQPHLPIRLPCYDSTPIISPTFAKLASDFGYYQLSWCDGRCVQGPGTYSPQYADLWLLAIPASWRRVAASNPN